MRRAWHDILVTAIAASGCGGRSLEVSSSPVDCGTGSISGRACDPSWELRSDAEVYTNLLDADGQILETRRAYSDKDGRWTLDDLPGCVLYSVYVAYGADLDKIKNVHVGRSEDVVLDRPDCEDPAGWDTLVLQGNGDVVPLLEDLHVSNRVVDGKDPVAVASAFPPGDVDAVFIEGGTALDGIDWAPFVTWVEAGGQVLLSDQACDLAEALNPDVLLFLGEPDTEGEGDAGDAQGVDAALSDASLASRLGKNYVLLTYDLAGWPVIQSVHGAVSVHLTGEVSWGDGSDAVPSSPLLVSFTLGQGRVVCSTYRPVAQDPHDMLGILTLLLSE